jgi:putative sigma-54 modulation protein
MQIKLTSRHFELDDGARAFAEEEISKLQRYFDNIIDAHLILEQEKSRLTAELTLKVYGTVLVAKTNGFEPVAAVEKVTGIMQRRLKKYKARLQDKRAKGRSLEKRTISGPKATPQE